MKFIIALLIALPVVSHAQLIPQVVQDGKKRNVFIEATSALSAPREASGINIGGNRILSALHVVDGMTDILVDGKPAKVVRQWKEKDLVLLHAPSSPTLPDVEVLNTMPTSEVFLVGNPRACRNKVLYGSMIGTQKSPIFDPTYKGSVWLADMFALPGVSGGAVWDREGRLVGVLKGWEKSGDVSVIVPAFEVRKFLSGDPSAASLALQRGTDSRTPTP
jgi:S1-C subfamily serine protease